jgi:hypothetical protein
MALFLKSLTPSAADRLLDVGGYPAFWKGVPSPEKITILNLHKIENDDPRFETVIGDGTNLQFRNDAFEIAHSNSVIEHLGTLKRQETFAREVRRVAQKLWVQTPARNFLVEPHFIDFFCHWFPRPIRRRLMRYFSLWGLIVRPSQKKIDEHLDQIRLLNLEEMQSLFPDCDILIERACGWPKSYIAVRNDKRREL